MGRERADRRREIRRNRANEVGAAAGSAPVSRSAPIWLIAVAALGGAAIAGAVVLQMTAAKPAAPPTAVPTPMPISITPSGTPTAPPTITPQPPGDAPPGKVWSPEHGHWHDAPTVTPQ